MSYTQGPWTASPDGLIHAGKNRLHIAQTATIGMGHAAAANARLMAAAPDLIAALESLNAAVIRAGYGNTAMPELTQAWAAIAKATGEIEA